MEKLHVISFDVPYPANYGGVIVVYNQLLAWKAIGVKVILHAYKYGDRKQQEHLESICHQVHYYERATGWRASISHLPYIVNSRKSESLLNRLSLDDYPIFFEGVHTTAWIGHRSLNKRKKALRMHNVEWKYYESLQQLGENIWKRFYYNQESRRLKAYDEKVLEHVDVLFTISEKDQDYYQSLHEHCYYLPAAHGVAFEVREGTGAYFLFHGKLSVEDNKKAALLLMEEVFAGTKYNFVIAGLDPDKSLIEAAAKHANVEVIANLSQPDLKSLIQDAQANILYTFQDNGIKLKLLHALHLGRHCIVNTEMVSNTNDLASLCEIGASIAEMKDLVEKVDRQPFTKHKIEQREEILKKEFNNQSNTKKALEILKKLGFN